MNKLLPSMLLILATLFFSACTLEPVDPEALDGEQPSVETPYRNGFRRVNRAPFTSQVGGGALVDVWVSAHAANEYAQVLLDGEGSGVTLPVGTVIVREVLDDYGEVATLTLMIKSEPGYYPEGGDYWYGVADPDGIIRDDESGNPLMGKLDACGSCHASRPNDDFLFGIPSDYH